MGKLKTNEKGFSAVAVILVLVIAVLIGIVGFLVHKDQHKTISASTTNTTSSTVATKTTTPTSTATTIPDFPSTYNGWNSYCISSVRLCMKYPQGYNLEICTDGPSPSDCGIETKDVRNASAGFPVVSWSIGLASSSQSGSCAQSGTYTVGAKLPYISNLYVTKYTVTNEPGFNGEVTYYLLEGNDVNLPAATGCPISFPRGKYSISISARDGSPATASLSTAQIAAYDQTIRQILNSFYYQ